MCEDSASFDLTSHDLAQCIGDVGHILELKKKEQNYLEEGGENWLVGWIFCAWFLLSVVIRCDQKISLDFQAYDFSHGLESKLPKDVSKGAWFSLNHTI